MFSWLVQRLFGRPEAQRGLFQYWDGQRSRQIDPIKAFRAIWTCEHCDLASDARTAQNPLTHDGKPMIPAAEVYGAEDRIRQMTREVFGVQAWSESTPGLTVDETDALLASFWAYIQQLKKKRNILPTRSLPSTWQEDLPSADTPPLPASLSQPTSEPDCGCTGAASSAAELTSPSAPSAAV